MINSCKYIFVLLSLSVGTIVFAGNDNKPIGASLRSRAETSLQNRSIGFEENLGQMSDNNGNPVPSVLYRMAGTNMQVLLTNKGLSYFFLKYTEEENEKNELTQVIKTPDDKPENRRVNYCRIDMELKGASIIRSHIISEHSSSAYSNYYYPHCIDGILAVRQYKKLTVKDVYPGIDWVIYLNDKNELKYDFVVAPGADHKLIRLSYLSQDKLKFSKTGDISMRTDIGSLSERSPVSFTQGSNENIATRFIEINEGSKFGGHETEIGFEVQTFDANKTLVIDPQIQWFTDFSFSGGWLGVSDISVNKQNGNLVLTGYTSNIGMPIYDPGGGAFFQGTLMGSQNVFVTELTSAGAVIWSTFFGGFNDGQTSGTGMAAEWDGFGNVFVTGNIRNLPLKDPGGGAYYSTTARGAFISKFGVAGNIIWSTWLGYGNGSDIVVNNANEVYLVGTAQNSGTGWPTFNPGGGAYFQGTNPAPAGGSRPYIGKFSNNGNVLWGTYFGAAPVGTLGFSAGCRDIAIDHNSGKIYITGQGDLPVLMNAGGFYQATGAGQSGTFIAGFNNSCNLIWATYLGGSASGYPCAIHCDDLGNIILTGITNSTNFPTKNPGAGAYFQGTNAGGYDIFISKFDPSTNMFWSTYYGGSLDDQSMANGDAYRPDIVTDKKNNIYVTGMTSSLNFPTYNSGCGSFLYNTGCNVIMQFCPSGVRLWATKFGEEGGYNGTNLGTANRFTSACAFDDATNSVYAGGEVYGPTMVNPLVNPGGGALFNSPFTAGDCSFIIKFKILPVTLTMSSVNATACSGCNGSATVTATCGLAPYTYSWNNGQSTQTATGLCAGTYSVIVKDAGCEQDTVYVTINPGSGSMTLAASKTDAGCGTNNGTATAAPGSGASPYTYSWSNGQTVQTATGLSVGSYTVSVTDAGGCFSTRSVTVSQPSAIVVNVNSSTQIICNNNSINVTVSGSGGAIPYVFNWNNGQAGPTATGLVAGTYTVTTTDASGCSASRSVVVTKLPPAFFSIYTTNGTCGNGGSATVFVYGGTQPYTYSWSGLSQTTPNITAVPAGTYTTTVSDANGCTTTKSFTITDTPALASATFTQSPAGTTVCVGTLVNFTNTGNPPGTGVTYNWIISPTTPTISGTTTDFSYTFLTAGSYTVSHAVSASGCSKIVTSTVSVITCSGGPTATATGSSVCPGTCATATSSAAGGSTPYTYSWSNGSTAQNINPCPVSTTTYTVTIRDSGGNTSTSTAVVTVNPAVTVSTTGINITCNGSADGSVIAAGGSGTLPYTYSWSNGGTASQISNLTSQIYTVTVTDSKGCTAISATVINSPAPLVGQFSKGTAACAQCGCKEWIMANAAGGTSPYSYTWPDGYVNRYRNQLCPGSYSVNVKDKNGCSVNINLTAP